MLPIEKKWQNFVTRSRTSSRRNIKDRADEDDGEDGKKVNLGEINGSWKRIKVEDCNSNDDDDDDDDDDKDDDKGDDNDDEKRTKTKTDKVKKTNHLFNNKKMIDS